MMKFKNLLFYKQVTRVYILSVLAGLFLSPFFDRFYVFIFKPKVFGEGLFFPIPNFFSSIITGFFFGIFLILPFCVFLLLKKSQLKIWGFGIVLPMFVVLGANTKHIIWALILSAIGWLLAQGVLLIKAKVKK